MSASETQVLTEQAVLEEARRRSGLDGFGDDSFREPMRRLLRALEDEAGLNAPGRAMQYERIVGLLVNRLRAEDYIRRYPEILDEQIERPFAIVGMARTGTTMLHRMIASDPRILSLLWYESRKPAPFPDSEGAEKDPRITDAEKEVEMMLEGSPELIAAHPMDAHAPDEEIMLVEHAFRSTNPEAFCNIPSFAAWLESQDATPGYEYLKRLLQFLQWQKKRRGMSGQRWVLKTPFHLGFMDVFFKVFPDVRIVLTHRDPTQTIPSFASLVHTLAVLGCDEVDPIAVGRHWGGKMQRAMELCMDVRERHEGRFIDVPYENLVTDPLVQVRRIYDFVGLELTPEVESRMREWAVENTRDKRPVHHYTLEKFGFTEEGLQRDFARYRRRFINAPI